MLSPVHLRGQVVRTPVAPERLQGGHGRDLNAFAWGSLSGWAHYAKRVPGTVVER